MESRNFEIENSSVRGFCKEISWKNKENSFFLSVGCCLVDFLLRFYGSEEVKKFINAFEFDVGQVLQGSVRIGQEKLRQYEVIKVFSQGYSEMKNVDKLEKLEYFYKELQGNKDFSDGLGELFKGMLIKNKFIDGQVDNENIQKVLGYFYSRYKMVIVVHINGNWVKSETKTEFAIFCPLNYEADFTKLLTKDAFNCLDNFVTEFKFPFIFKPNWLELIEEFKEEGQEEKTYNENNEKLLKLLNEIMLQTPLSHEEEDLILEEYSKSGAICEELDCLKLRKFTVPKTMRFPNHSIKTCDKCKTEVPDPSIYCSSHTECMNCRKKSFSSDFSSICSHCNRPLTPEELTILNSYLIS